jgi:hypothetical protein
MLSFCKVSKFNEFFEARIVLFIFARYKITIVLNNKMDCCSKFDQIVLIFPKMFEMSRFLTAAASNFVVTNEVFRDCDCYNLLIDIEGFVCRPYVISLGESDINFTFKLQNLLQKLIRPNEKLYLVLCGTCGGSSLAGHKLEETFQVIKAVKFDRGELGLVGGKLEFVSNKTVSSACSNPTSVLNPKIVLCSNYIMSFDPIDLAKVFETEGANLVDMETFEFFSVCEMNRIHSYDCLRIVSDITVTGRLYSVDEKAETRTRRKGIDMSKLLNKVVNILHMKRATACRKNSIDLESQSLHDYFNVCNNLGVAPNENLYSMNKKRRAGGEQTGVVISKKCSDFR